MLDAMTTAAFRTVVNATRHKDGKKNYIPVISSLSVVGVRMRAHFGTSQLRHYVSIRQRDLP